MGVADTHDVPTPTCGGCHPHPHPLYWVWVAEWVWVWVAWLDTRTHTRRDHYPVAIFDTARFGHIRVPVLPERRLGALVSSIFKALAYAISSTTTIYWLAHFLSPYATRWYSSPLSLRLRSFLPP